MGMSKDLYRISREKLDSLSYEKPLHEVGVDSVIVDKDWEQIAVLLSEGNLGSSPFFELFHPYDTISPESLPIKYHFHDEEEVGYILGMIDGWTESQLMGTYRLMGKQHHVFKNFPDDYLPTIVRKTLALIECFRKAAEEEEVIVVITDF